MKRVCRAMLIIAGCVMLWPAGALAAPPAPKGALVYSDDFSGQQSAGLVTADDYSSGTHAPGVYHLRILKNQTTRWSLFPNQTYGQFSLDLELWDNSDDFVGDASGGVVFRVQDADHLYAVQINSRGKEGQYTVRKLDGANNWSDLVAWKPSALIKLKDNHNHLRVDADGATFTIYLNDELLDTVTDSAYARGGLGMLASNVDANQPHMHYDNVKIYSTEAAGGAGTGTSTSTLPTSGQADPAAPWGLSLIALGLICLGIGLRGRPTPRAVPLDSIRRRLYNRQ